jgi:N-acetylneuraminic acid mutarotase
VTSRVDIYDTVSQTWSTAELTQARYDISVIAVGNKIFFAGGTDDWFFTSRIDIYDVSSNTWSTAELSKARGRMAVAAIGNRVFFAGGDCFDGDAGGTMINSVSDVVDIYDISTNTWTVSHLSERRGNLEFAGTSLNNKFYVAGGFFTNGGLSLYFK